MKSQLTALALALSTVFAPVGATAQDVEPTNVSVDVDTEIGQHAYLTSEEALQQSRGRVVLHVGDGFSTLTLDAVERHLEEAGLEVEIANGGPNGAITSYFYGNHFPPQNYSDSEVHNLIIVLIEVARHHNLIASQNTETPEQS